MFTMYADNTRTTIGTLAAVAIVSFHALALDQAHIAAAPRGTVEVGELTMVEAAPMAAVSLPEVTVVARREAAGGTYFAASTQLPEIVVVAKRVSHMVARSASVQGPAEGALLK